MDTDHSSENEVWRDVVGYEGFYEVSNFGNMKRISKGVVKNQRLCSVANGYLGLCLYREGRKTTKLVHILVARAFIGDPPIGFVVNHIDEDKRNNHISNLEYLTRGDNVRYSAKKLDRAKVQEIRNAYKPRVVSYRMLAKQFGVDHSLIYQIIHGKKWDIE